MHRIDIPTAQADKFGPGKRMVTWHSARFISIFHRHSVSTLCAKRDSIILSGLRPAIPYLHICERNHLEVSGNFYSRSKCDVRY